MPLKVTEGSLCDVNPTLNRDPRTAMPFLEADHLAENNNAIAVRTVPESELRSARGITWARFFTIEPAVDVTAVAAEKVRGFHALHLAPRVVNVHLRVLGANRSPHNRTLDMLKVDTSHFRGRNHLSTFRAYRIERCPHFFKIDFPRAWHDPTILIRARMVQSYNAAHPHPQKFGPQPSPEC